MPGISLSEKPSKDGSEKKEKKPIEVWEVKLLIARLHMYFDLEQSIEKQVSEMLERSFLNEDVGK